MNKKIVFFTTVAGTEQPAFNHGAKRNFKALRHSRRVLIGRLFLVALAAALAFAGCNKDVDDEYGVGAGAYKLEKPTACPISGNVAYNTSITLYNPTNKSASIYYTTDGSTPTTDSTLYSDSNRPRITKSPSTIKAICAAEGLETSVEATFNYTIDYDMAASPNAEPPAGEYTVGTPITLYTSTEGASIYYTINGDDPDENSIKYSEDSPPAIPAGGITITAIAVKSGMTNSAPQRFDYTVAPVVAPSAPSVFYKEVNEDGSGGIAQDISGEAGDTLIDKAISWLTSNAAANTRYTLYLSDNIPEQSPKDIDNAAFHNAEGVTFFITTPTDENEVTVNVGESSSIFHLSGNKAKTLAVDGAVNLVGIDDNNSPLIIAEDKAVFKLNGSAKISGNTSDSETGGGVAVINGGTFTMTGGEIYGNDAKNKSKGRGGGVYVGENSTFTMEGGAIHDNCSYLYGGGVYVVDNGSAFTMKGGEIHDNSNHGNGGGVAVWENGTFTMEGGVIYGNTAGAHYGGGIYVRSYGTFIMERGRIQGNPGDGSYKPNIGNYSAALCITSRSTATFGSGGGLVGNTLRDPYADIITDWESPQGDETIIAPGE